MCLGVLKIVIFEGVFGFLGNDNFPFVNNWNHHPMDGSQVPWQPTAVSVFLGDLLVEDAWKK